MISSLRIQRNLFVLIFLMITACDAMAGDVRYPPLSMQGDIYPNVCEAAKIEEVHQELRKKMGDKDELFKIIEVILCAQKDAVSRKLVRTMIGKSVSVHLEGTGEEPEIKVVVPNEELVDRILADGHAWLWSVQSSVEDIILSIFLMKSV